MKKNIWKMMTIILVITGMMFFLSCAKKEVAPAPAVITPPAETVSSGPTEAELEAQRLAEKAAKAVQRFINEDIYFDFDKSSLTDESQDKLKFKAKWLRNNSGSVTIEGHCDERGTEEYNLALGSRRAQSVKTFLVDLGIDATRLNTITYGEERPADPGSNESAWSKNRRAHFSLD